ncbi:LOW QUALITY PROTEIN: cyclin-dependent kinase 2-interacting protein-like [Vombatus ursinus]|uniref:LOW QUALITY PROTEIN: cyclin-dependent kinase 2-interacting protein-like n=1 Tax=Vombatus ursinus TaxID=29139 RepID=UPI000FFD617F|nr:LOW QUALITY PROTEIN: cyclin-dependent kinase 2-interacting protein-like [Vombatus ursinus]
MWPGPKDVKNSGMVTPKRTILSVSARKIKDNAADWHNVLSKWETLNNTGFSVATKIGNIKITALTEDKVELECNSIASGFHSQKVHPKYIQKLEMLCKELHKTLENLAKLQAKMEKSTSTTKEICNLENYHSGNGNCQTPLFHTWPTTYFYEVSLKLSEMYKKEILFKCIIVEELTHAKNQNLILSYLSMWLYQPYAENSRLDVESMLLETGHQAL